MEELKATLARIDERTQGMQREVHLLREEIKSRKEDQQREFTRLRESVEEHTAATEKQIEEIRHEYVSKDAFTPVQRIAYGIMALFATGVVGAILKVAIGVTVAATH